MREASFRKDARETFSRCSAKDQENITYLVLLLERDPEVDGVLKRTLMRPPLVFRVLRHMGWEIVYYVPDAASIVIYSIARA